MFDFPPQGVSKPATKERLAFFALVTLIIAAGAWLRMKDALAASFPINDGGLHFVLIQELVANHFRLPMITSYNHLSIPFVYPPLSTYFAAFVHVWFGIDILKILTLAPPLFAVGTLVGFAWVAHLALIERRATIGALYCFAIAPWVWVQAIKGGGLPRGLGLLFALLAIGFALRICRKKPNMMRHATYTGAFLGLTALSHPEAALFGGISVAYLLLTSADNPRTAMKSLVVLGLVAFVVLCPWVLVVSLRHGLSAFASAASSNDVSILTNVILFLKLQMPIWDGQLIPYIAGLVGLVLCLRKHVWLAGWCLAVLIGCVRGTPIYLSVVLAILGGLAFSGVIAWCAPLTFPINKRLVRALAAALLVFELVETGRMIPRSTNNPLQSLSAFDREAAQWAMSNTPPDVRFHIVTGSRGWWNDPITEWFPALARRRSDATCQGSEWLPAHKFHHCLERYDALQNCLRLSTECLQQLAQMSKQDFVYVSRNLAVSDHFLYFLATNKEFIEVFRNNGVRIFRRES
ncbi:MAG: hypothetical protein U0587_15815 [Candidatus Binatia bacterium]